MHRAELQPHAVSCSADSRLRGPAAPTWSLLQACFLSRLLNLTGLEVIALILLILIVHQEVFISGFSLS